MLTDEIKSKADLERFIRQVVEQTPANAVQGVVDHQAQVDRALAEHDERLKKGGL